MNKPIINGIDVSECEFYNNYECDAYRHEYWEPQDNTKDMCEWHKDCYFKQLKRLQEENEELKKRQITKNGFICDCEQNAKYKQALEEIREIAQIHQYFNPKLLEIKGDIGQMQDLKMTEIFKKCNEALNDRD